MMHLLNNKIFFSFLHFLVIKDLKGWQSSDKRNGKENPAWKDAIVIVVKSINIDINIENNNNNNNININNWFF